jgi:26S proteasome regulatory subunit N7
LHFLNFPVFGSILTALGASSDLAKFIAAGRIPCTIDRVSGNGVIETNRPDDKNKQYQDVVRQGDQLITKLQKYGQAVRLRGSERA